MVELKNPNKFILAISMLFVLYLTTHYLYAYININSLPVPNFLYYRIGMVCVFALATSYAYSYLNK